MRPATILTTVFASLVAQSQITAAVPLQQNSDGSGPRLDGRAEPVALLERTDDVQLAKRIDASNAVQLVAACTGMTVVVLKALHDFTSDRRRDKLAQCTADKINEMAAKIGKHPGLTADKVKDDMVKGAKIGKTVEDGINMVADKFV